MSEPSEVFKPLRLSGGRLAVEIVIEDVVAECAERNRGAGVSGVQHAAPVRCGDGLAEHQRQLKQARLARAVAAEQHGQRRQLDRNQCPSRP
jgi:hypothetical protein